MFRAGLVVLILGLGIWAFYQKPFRAQPDSSVKTEPSKLNPKPDAVSENLNPSNPSAIETKLHQEASLIGKIDSAPADTEERLQKWAESLSLHELEQLEVSALNTQKPQDDRFLAVMLMAWSKKAEALEHLKDIALAEIDPYLSPNRAGDFERILRMQAIDGMLDLPAHSQHIENTLQSVAAKTGDSTLADRAYRALWALRGEAAKPKEQEQKAFEEVLKKPKH